MTEGIGHPVSYVGPIDFKGPAVEREARIREDNNHEAVDVAQWYANTLEQKPAMEAAESAFFAELRSRAAAS